MIEGIGKNLGSVGPVGGGALRPTPGPAGASFSDVLKNSIGDQRHSILPENAAIMKLKSVGLPRTSGSRTSDC